MKAEFTGPNQEIFSLSYGPNDSDTLVLLLQPFPWEMQRIAWTYNQLAKRLAKKGILAKTFHYLSSGDSAGSSRHFSIEQGAKDLELILSQANQRRIILLGTRLGANLAISCSKQPKIIAKLAVDPIENGSKYLADQTVIHRSRLSKKGYWPPYLTESNVKGQLLGYEFSKSLESEVRAIKLNLSTTDKVFYTQASPAGSKGQVIGEPKSLWENGDKLTLSHFSHLTMNHLLQEIDEVLS